MFTTSSVVGSRAAASVVCSLPPSAALRDPPGSNWCALRSNRYLNGIPHLTSSKQVKINQANTQMRNSSTILTLCIRYGVPSMFENPKTSLMWQTAQFRRLAAAQCANLVSFDQCQFGARWRKATSILSFHLCDLSPLCLRCRGHNYVCSATGRRHIVLVGAIPGSNKCWTSAAQAYPSKLCSTISSLFNDTFIARRYDLLRVHI